jgi:anti-anti-sigma regulatory factor
LPHCAYPADIATGQSTIHIVGHCEYLNCAPLRKFLDTLTCGGRQDEIVLEFSDCLSIDSTALGLIAKAAITVRKTPGRKLVLANLRNGPRNAVIQLGLKHLTHIEELPERRLNGSVAHVSHVTEVARVDRKTIREAHEVLATISPENRSLFADVVSFIGGPQGVHARA